MTDATNIRSFHITLATISTFLISSIENAAFEVGNQLADEYLLRGLITNPAWFGYVSVVVTQIGVYSLILLSDSIIVLLIFWYNL